MLAAGSLGGNGMAALNKKTLAALGADRLADLMLEVVEGDALAKRRLRLELAGAEGPEAAGREISKRLAAIGKSRAYVDWDKQAALARDLDMQRRAILALAAPGDPALGFDLMWRFLALAPGVFARADDGGGRIQDVFLQAADDIADLVGPAAPAPADLADRLFDALPDDWVGLTYALIVPFGEALGPAGLSHLKSRLDQEGERALEAHDLGRVRRLVADAQGDVEAFIAELPAAHRKTPVVAAEIARRYLAADRPEDALAALDAAAGPKGAKRALRTPFGPPPEALDLRIEALEAVGRRDEAQGLRLTAFVDHLSAPHLKDHLKRLPDFDDMEAEEAALAQVEAEPRLPEALAFLLNWPALDRLARVVTTRVEEIDGDAYQVLSPAADALEAHHPLAASLVRRAMIEDSLDHGRSSRYRHAARHFAECASAAARIETYGAFEPHDDFAARLRRNHGRKSSFWSLVKA